MTSGRRIAYTTANDVLHDLALGVFPGVVVGTWLIDRTTVSTGEGSSVVAHAAPVLWLVFAFGLLVSVATGLLRLRYWKLNVRSGYMNTKSAVAAMKHSAFVLLLLGSATALWYITN